MGSKPRFIVSLNQFILFLLLIINISLLGCGNSDSRDSKSTSSTGEIAFSLAWSESSHNFPQSHSGIQGATGNACDDYLIETVSAYIYDVTAVEDIDNITANPKATGGPWLCNDRVFPVNVRKSIFFA